MVQDEKNKNEESSAVREARRMATEDVMGASEWKKSKLSWALGVGTIAGAARAGLRGVTEPATVTLKAAKGFFKAETANPLPTQESDPAARFRVAQNVYGRDDADIRMDVDATSKWFSIYFVVTALVLGYALASMSSIGGGILPAWTQLISSFALMPAALALTVRMGFMNWQLRKRRLSSVVEYLRTPRDWMAEPSNSDGPGGSGGGRMRGISRMACAMMVAGSLSFGGWMGTNEADAEVSATQSISNILTIPPKTDLWLNLLAFVMPAAGPLDGLTGLSGIGMGLDSPMRGSQISAIQNAFGAFLATLMALSSLGLAYYTMIGTISTAHEGKVMGQRWHTFYAPVRVVTGFAMLVPVSKGLCMAQIIVLYLAVWGGAFGNIIWTGYISSLGNRQDVIRYDPVVMPTLRDIAMLEICWAASQADLGATNTMTNEGSPSVLPSLTMRGIDPDTWRRSGPMDISSVATSRFARRASGIYGTSPTPPGQSLLTASYGGCGGIDLAATISGNQPTETYDQKMKDAIDAFRQGFRRFARQLVSISMASSNTTNPELPDPALAVALVTDFNRAMMSAQDGLRADTLAVGSSPGQGFTLESLKLQMASYGWASAGTYYIAISNFHESYATSANKLPSLRIGGQASDYMSGQNSSAITGLISQYTNFWNSLLNSTPNLSPSVLAMSRLGRMTEGSNGEGFGEILSTMGLHLALGELQVNLQKGSGMDHLIRFGHKLLTVWWTIVAFIMALTLAGPVLSAVGGFIAGAATGPVGAVAGAASGAATSRIVVYLAGILQFLMIIILAVGIIHAYVLPMIPYIMMFFFIIGMLILVIEGMVAAPLWAFFHIRPDGQEFIEQVQRPGYMILFNLVLRIPLALFGLFFSYLMLDALMWFESVTFIPAFLGATTNHSFGVMGILAAFCMLGFLHWQICIRSFGLITHLPDNVSRWFGQAGERLGEDNDTKQILGGMVNRTENKIQNLGGAGMMGTPGAGGGRDKAQEARQGDDSSGGTASTGTPSGGRTGGQPAPPSTGDAQNNAAGRSEPKVE